VCIVEQAAERYSSVDQAKAADRAERWRDVVRRSRHDAHLVTLRQRRRRLTNLIRPLQPPASPDPWEIAASAIGEARKLQKRYAASRPEIEDIIEGIRRLAWGPEPDHLWLDHLRPRRHREYPGQMTLWDDEEVVAA
jgi:hypothetical protein